jgi:hypothetical protein
MAQYKHETVQVVEGLIALRERERERESFAFCIILMLKG